VTIIGAGPAGLLLGCILQGSGAVDCTILERHSRAHIEGRQRAGLLEHRTVELLRQHGLADRLQRHAHQHDSCEFRIDGESVVVKFGPLAGAAQYVWPQHELVVDLLEAFLLRGGTVHFEAADVAVHGATSPQPEVSFRHPTTGPQVLTSPVVVGADGFHGISRASIPAAAVRTIAHELEFGWVAVLAQTPPSAPHAIYAVHRDGFAGHMLRSPFTPDPPPTGAAATGTTPPTTRFYLQCGRPDSIEQWSDARIWEQLHARLANTGDTGWVLHDGPIIDKSILQMRSVVAEPMRFGQLFLIGDAAHIITPIGAKGMNLALNDARVLAQALLDWTVQDDDTGLARFSDDCLARVWQCQAFSNSFTHLIHHPPPDAPDAEFRGRLGRTRLAALLRSDAELTAFARSYVGI
jgi:p-hydroxybenzoate 3-monooxygenase